MPYQPKIGDLIFVRGEGLVDKAIEWAENGKYSHVALYAGDGKVLEAQGGRLIGYADLSEYAGHYDIGRINASMERRQRVLAYAKSKIGTRYGWRAIFLLALKLVLHINRPYAKWAPPVCSFYAEDSWADGGDYLLTRVDKPTPQDLADSPRVYIEKPN